MIQISNNPYGKTLRGMGSRPRLDSGQLGITCLVSRRGSRRLRLPGRCRDRAPGPVPGLHVLGDARRFEVTSEAPVELGLDGEALVMDPPLRILDHGSQIRVRLSHHAIGYSPAARSLGVRQSLHELWRVALGHHSRFQR